MIRLSQLSDYIYSRTWGGGGGEQFLGNLPSKHANQIHNEIGLLSLRM